MMFACGLESTLVPTRRLQPDAALKQVATKNLTVIPAEAGIYRPDEAWIPAFAGMTTWELENHRRLGRS
jgi:hypothetical protein